jgi:hypothetical protein
MRQLIYGMQFTGYAEPAQGSPGVLRASTSAPSCTITSLVGAEGVAGIINPAAGGTAVFESEVTITGESSFVESGTLSFGKDGHGLIFDTVGSGHLAPGPEPGVQQGAVIWRVKGGHGQFSGARGLITSNFLVGPDNKVTDHHFGMIYLDEP